MAYIKQNWVNGETVATAERMNHIEDGIKENENISNNINENLGKKLDKTSVKTTKTQSDTDTYSCNYINVKGKTLRCGINSNQNIQSQTVTKVNFNKYLSNNFNDDYANYFRLNDGFIEVMNDNISCVVFIASCQLNGMGENNIYITKSGAGRYAVSTNSANGASAIAIIPVTKGDKIYVEIYGNSAGSISNWTDMTFIEVVAI